MEYAPALNIRHSDLSKVFGRLTPPTEYTLCKLMISMLRLAWTPVFATLLVSTIQSAQAVDEFMPPEVVTILADLPISKVQKTPQQSPIDNANGAVYIANIEAGPSGDTDGYDLQTVVRKGSQSNSGIWSWESHVVEDRTVADAWHTVPSIALDKNGYVHVAYNMHNLPWQYQLSTQPYVIDSYEFLGEELSTADIIDLKVNNRTHFPELGKAAIPGTQVTYPAFFKDNRNDLYLTYRFAAKPARKFKDRAMSSGIAKYNSTDKTWESIGVEPLLEKSDFKAKWYKFFEKPVIPKVFALGDGWTSYHPRLMFDPDNNLSVSWMWREGIAGSELTRPCFLSSKNNIEFRNTTDEIVELPASPDDCGNIMGTSNTQKYNSIGNSVMNSKGEAHLILSPTSGSRQLVSFVNNQWVWEDSPYGATEIFFDKHDNLWALASGLSILVRKANTDKWQKVLIADEKIECRPKASLNNDKSIAYIYSPNCRKDTVSIKMINLNLDFPATN